MGNRVKPVEENSLLKKSFNLMPGTKLNWNIKTQKGSDSVTWEVFTDTYNNSYILCHETKSVAWFQYNGVNFCFTHFTGDRNSLLYSFYLAAYKVPLVYIDCYKSTDYLPVNHTFKGWRLFLHDFTSPFFMYLKATVDVKMKMVGSEFDPERIEYTSKLSGYSFNRKVWTKDFKFEVNRDNSLKFEEKKSELVAICESY